MKLRTLFLALVLTQTAHAQEPVCDQSNDCTPIGESWVYGSITDLFVDPSDVVIRLTNSSGCPGGEWEQKTFHLQRSNTNFDELFMLMTLADDRNRDVGIAIKGCKFSGRSVISHGLLLNNN